MVHVMNVPLQEVAFMHLRYRTATVRVPMLRDAAFGTIHSDPVVRARCSVTCMDDAMVSMGVMS